MFETETKKFGPCGTYELRPGDVFSSGGSRWLILALRGIVPDPFSRSVWWVSGLLCRLDPIAREEDTKRMKERVYVREGAAVWLIAQTRLGCEQ